MRPPNDHDIERDSWVEMEMGGRFWSAGRCDGRKPAGGATRIKVSSPVVRRTLFPRNLTCPLGPCYMYMFLNLVNAGHRSKATRRKTQKTSPDKHIKP